MSKMNIFSTQTSVFFINGDYIVYPWDDGDIAIVDVVGMMPRSKGWTYVTPYMAHVINPATIRSVHIPGDSLTRHVKKSWCREIITELCYVGYMRCDDMSDMCRQILLQIHQYLDGEMY